MTKEEVKRRWHRWLHPRPSEIHPWRWRALTFWIIVFSISVFFALRQNSNQSAELKEQSATLVQLEKTNCNTKVFLLTAREARLDSADTNFGIQRESDLKAAAGYKAIADNFTAIGRCKIPLELRVHKRAKERR